MVRYTGTIKQRMRNVDGAHKAARRLLYASVIRLLGLLGDY
jgi:hypothetical protein